MIDKRIKEGKHKGWISRNIRSYPEKFFDKVLKNNNLFDRCETNYKISKKDLGLECHSNYFLDYYFVDVIIIKWQFIDGVCFLRQQFWSATLLSIFLYYILKTPNVVVKAAERF